MLSMKRFSRYAIALVAGAVLLAAALPAIAQTKAKAFNIQGTYKLVSRDLPDGTKQHEPEVIGLVTFTQDMRNFNVAWKDKAGKHFSAASVSKYKLTPTQYTETNLYCLMNDEIGGKTLQYDLSDTT